MYLNTIPHIARNISLILGLEQRPAEILSPATSFMLMNCAEEKSFPRLRRRKASRTARENFFSQHINYGMKFVAGERVEAAPLGNGTASGNKEVEVYI